MTIIKRNRLQRDNFEKEKMDNYNSEKKENLEQGSSAKEQSW